MEIEKFPFLGPQFEAMARELSMLAIACDIDVEQEGVAERIIRGDETICRLRNPDAFRKLQEAMMALCNLEEKALYRMSGQELRSTLDDVWGAMLKLRAMGKADSDDS